MTFIKEENIKYLHCNNCGKQVSSGYMPVPTDTPDKRIIVRAWIECPECIGNKTNEVYEEVKRILNKETK